MPTDSSTLKPCPFCGGEAVLTNNFCSFKEWAFVRCQTCGSATKIANDTSQAAEIWNKRVEEKD